MEITRLSSDLKFANEVGMTLNIEERMKLDVSVLKLNETEKFDQCLFWGKILGLSADYYIIMGLKFRNLHSFPLKRYFFANEDFNFSELPESNSEYKDFIENIRIPFTGQREFILLESEQSEENLNHLNDGEEENIQLPVKNITELDRLAYFVRTVEEECQIIPVGSYKLTPTGELRFNESFQGLSIKEGQNIINFQHFRIPATEEKRKFIEMGEALFKLNFLDSLEKDLPTGCWSLQTDTSKTNITVRNLVWPGYVGYHRTNSKIFGGFYFGDGVKNQDLLFLI